MPSQTGCTPGTAGRPFYSYRPTLGRYRGWTSYWTSPGSRYFNPAGVGSYFDAGAGAGGAIVPIYTYTLDDANRATITGYSGNATALYIPGEIDGQKKTVYSVKGMGLWGGISGFIAVDADNNTIYRSRRCQVH